MATLMAGAAVVVFITLPAVAVSGIATVTSVSPSTNLAVGNPVQVAGAGCVTPNGRANTAALFLRGPAPSTVVTPAMPSTTFVDAAGGFTGIFALPVNGAVGDTYVLLARCTEEGQPPGPFSAGVSLTVARPSPIPGFPTGPPAGATGLTAGGTTGGGTGGATTPTTVRSGAATGRATPVPAQPRFTG